MQGDEPEHVRKWLEYSTGKSNWSKEVHDDIRKQNAIQLSSLMKHLSRKYSCSVFAFGDMNTTTAADVFKVYAENEFHLLIDLTSENDEKCSIHGNPIRGTDGRFHGKKTVDNYESSIDHIIGMGANFTVKQYRIVDDQDALDATDHSPVYADIDFA